MNPDNNNPFSNPGTNNTPGSIGLNPTDDNMSPSPLPMPGSDSMLAPSSDSLTSTSQELHSMALHNVDLTDPSSQSTSSPDPLTNPPYNPPSPTPDIPLTPAAPVPGSIGSVTSVPAAPNNSMSNTPEPSPSTTSASSPVSSASLTNPAPSTNATTSGPYNPFAQPSVTPTQAPATTPLGSSATHAAGASTPSSTMSGSSTPGGNTSTSSAFQPIQPSAPAQSTSPLKKSTNNSASLIIIMAIALVVSIIVAIVFAVLYFMASANNNTATGPVDTKDDEISQSEVKEIDCVKGADDVTGSEVILNYTGDKLRQITLYSHTTAESAEAASAQREILESQRRDTLNLAGLAEDPYGVAFTTRDNIIQVNATASADQLTTDEVAAIFMLPAVDGEVDTSEASVLNTYEGLGFVCIE